MLDEEEMKSEREFIIKEPQINADESRRGDNLYANCMQIARKNYNLTLIGWGYREAEPQINVDERGYKPAKDLGAAHRKVRKVRKDRKAQPQYGTRMTRIFTDIANPRASASSAQSAFHHVCSSLKNRASGASVSAFNPVHPVILSKRKCWLFTHWRRAKEVG